jgi:hypothetical protein
MFPDDSRRSGERVVRTQLGLVTVPPKTGREQRLISTRVNKPENDDRAILNPLEAVAFRVPRLPVELFPQLSGRVAVSEGVCFAPATWL